MHTPTSASAANTAPPTPPSGAATTLPTSAAPVFYDPSGRLTVAGFSAELKALDELLALDGIKDAEYKVMRAVLVDLYRNGPPATHAAHGGSENIDSTMSWEPVAMSRESFVRIHPWAPTYVSASLGLANIEAEYQGKNWDGLRTLALERARQNNVCSIERMLLSMFLFDEDVEKAAFYLCHYILTVPSGMATTYHNVASLQRVDKAYRRHIAESVCEYPEAVWYPVKGHDMHTLLMRGAQTDRLVGGAVDWLGSLAPRNEPLMGGAYHAPIFDKEGNVVLNLDLSDLETFLGGAQATDAAHFRSIEQKLAQLVTAAKAKQRQQYRGNNNNAYKSNVRNRRGPSYRGGADGPVNPAAGSKNEGALPPH